MADVKYRGHGVCDVGDIGWTIVHRGEVPNMLSQVQRQVTFVDPRRGRLFQQKEVLAGVFDCVCHLFGEKRIH